MLPFGEGSENVRLVGSMETGPGKILSVATYYYRGRPFVRADLEFADPAYSRRQLYLTVPAERVGELITLLEKTL
jgi:hypothetical protein